MAENKKTKGRFLLTEKDFVEVVDADGKDLPPVPKHWDEDQLAPGASKKSKPAKKAASSSGSGSGSGGGKGSGTGTEPAGNASTEAWVDFAKSKGATDADLTGADGEPLGREELKAKYGTPAS
jgi:hypothetical protein